MIKIPCDVCQPTIRKDGSYRTKGKSSLEVEVNQTDKTVTIEIRKKCKACLLKALKVDDSI